MAFENSVWRRASVASSRKVKADTEGQTREESFPTFRRVFDRKRIYPPTPHPPPECVRSSLDVKAMQRRNVIGP